MIPGVLAIAALLGCENPDAASLFEDSKEYRYARATQAMSYLKKYQVAANFGQVETGRYGLLQNIYENTAEALEGGGYVSHGEEWTFYTAKYEDIGEPVRHWPSDDELAGKFRALKPRLRR